MLDWIDSKIKKTDSTEIIDLQYFAKYQPKSGFKFALDGFHNVPDSSIPYIGLYCLNPPAALYQHPLDANLVHLNSNFNWEDSAAQSPQFLEGFVTFRDVRFDKNLTLIIDVQTIAFKKKTVPVFKPIGWTVLSIFSPNGYVQSGIFQLPIFEGPVPKDIIEQLPLNDPWPFLMELVAQKKSRIKFLEPMSAIVRLLDSQREVFYFFIKKLISFRVISKKLSIMIELKRNSYLLKKSEVMLIIVLLIQDFKKQKDSRPLYLPMVILKNITKKLPPLSFKYIFSSENFTHEF